MSRLIPLALGTASLVLALCLTIPSCTAETIPLATLVMDAGISCVSNSDCQAGTTFCSKVSCGDATGECQPFPPDCNWQAESDVCGCTDGFTYYNDCLRKQNGAMSSTTGPCLHGNPCQLNGSQPCPDAGGSQICAVEYNGKGSCSMDVQGSCWSLPPACAATPDGTDRFDSCIDPNARCMDVCTAIRSATPYYRHPGFCPNPPQGN